MSGLVQRMHVDEFDTDVALVGRLIGAQFPEWARELVSPVSSSGTDHALYRLGGSKVVRLPRIASAAWQVEKEQRWLPVLTPYLPLAVPCPLAKGAPGEGYPWPWSVYEWLEGENATVDRIGDIEQTAVTLGGFVLALQQVDPAGGPPPGPANSYRGVPLAERDGATRAAIASLDGSIDRAAAMAAWEAALRVPPWTGPPIWIHGDLQSGNLLAVDGRLRAVIDFGCLGVGDPACDLMVAWNLFTAETRPQFRSALRVDDATWRRGRGWALSVGVIALPYYKTSNPALAAIARHAIAEVLMEHEREGHHR